MLDSLTNGWSALRDRAVEAGARAYVNGKIDRFGSVTRFELNSRERTLLLELELKGETSPISVAVGSYYITEDNGARYIAFGNVQASREWIGLALVQYLAGRRFKLPDALSNVL